MSVANIIPQSGVQLIIVIGAAFLMAGVRPSLGMNLLALGIIVWGIYNVINLARQF